MVKKPLAFRAFFLALFGLAGLACAGAPAAAEPSHGIAMHGAPKFDPDFQAVDFVNPAAPKGGRLRLAVVGSFDSVNPFIVKGTPAFGPMVNYNRYLGKLVYESLLRRSPDEPFTLYGLIAEKVEMGPDRRWIRFQLNPEARFQDGEPVTPEDVLFSWRTLRDHGRPNHRLYYGKVETAEITAPDTVTFTFKADGNAELPLILGLLPILPAHYFADRPFERTTLTPFPGSGPYRISEVEAGRRIAFTRDPDYWGKDLQVNRGLFNFDEVSVDFYRDSTAAFEAFKSSLYDLRLETEPDKWRILSRLKGSSARGLKMAEIPNGWPAPTRGFVFNTRRAIFADPQVRAALAHAFDFEWANRAFFQNSYERTRSFFDKSELKARGPAEGMERRILQEIGAATAPLFAAPAALPKIDDTAALRRNLREAANRLEKAGWDVEHNRLVNAETGAPFTFEILISNPGDERLALHFARNLRRLGIYARVNAVDSTTYQARLDSYDFDMTIYRWDLSLSPGNELAFYFAGASADITGTRNYMGARNPAIDALIQRIVASPTRQALVAAARALDRVLLAGHYIIPLYHAPAEWLAYRAPLARPAQTPLEGYILEAWWAAPESDDGD